MRKLILLMILILPLGLLAQMDPGTYLRDYLRIRSDLSGKDSVYHIQGKVYSLIPGEKSMELFAYDAFQISRIVETETGFRLLAREAGVFRDHRTRQILHSWRNPFTQETLPIIHIWNDPVNQVFEYEANTLPFIRQFLPSTELEDKVVYHSEIFPFYPHVLPRRLFGEIWYRAIISNPRNSMNSPQKKQLWRIASPAGCRLRFPSPGSRLGCPS